MLQKLDPSLTFEPAAPQQPPQNLAAEDAILGGILVDPQAFSRVAGLLTSKSFLLPANQMIYAAMLALNREEVPIDVIALITWLRDRGRLDRAGGENRIRLLEENTIAAVNIDQFAKLLQNKLVRRHLNDAGVKMQDFAHDTEMPLSEVIDRSEQLVMDLRQSLQNDGLQDVATVLDGVSESIDLNSRGLAPPALICGLHALDAITGGFNRSDLIIVAGRPSMGKTVFMVEVAMLMAKLHGLPIGVFSMEMSRHQLAMRMLSSVAGIEGSRLRSGRLSGEKDWGNLGRACGELSSLPIYIDDTPDLTVMEVRSRSRRLKAEHGPLGAIVVDYIQLLEVTRDIGRSNSFGNREQALSQITRSLKGLARELNVPVIALSQLSRKVEERSDKHPMLADLRESGAIEQDSDLVMMLYRDEFYAPNSDKRGLLEVGITKHRTGPSGISIELLFDRQFTRVRNLPA